MPTDVHNALRLVGLQSLINALPDGAETVLTSGGSPLSANQLRLLSIARAMAGDPGLIVLDGTLDSLSDEDLEIVIAALTGEHRTWSVLVMTGRAAVAERFDQTIQTHRTTLPGLAGATA